MYNCRKWTWPKLLPYGLARQNIGEALSLDQSFWIA